MNSMFEHQDSLDSLNKLGPLKNKLASAHSTIKNKFSFIARIAVTLYDPETKVLKTYLHSSGDDNPIQNYQALLDESHSLKEILEKGRPRVVNSLVTFDNGKNEHTQRIGRQGYASSYTMPMFNNGIFFGFLFFNAYEKDVFNEEVLNDLDVYGHLISLMMVNEVSNINMLRAALKTTSDMVHVRDPETGSHLDRMSRYSRIIAKELADSHQLNDEYIEHVFMFAPLHDIGKIAIPDSILLKADSLDEYELKIMRTHAQKGREMIDSMIDNFGLDNISNINILRNIAEFHHESVNGTGYPEGKMQNEIPLEARIVAVADVFDALTSCRSYKKAWSNDDAIDMLLKLANEKLDNTCVDALIKNRAEVENIQHLFSENAIG